MRGQEVDRALFHCEARRQPATCDRRPHRSCKAMQCSLSSSSCRQRAPRRTRWRATNTGATVADRLNASSERSWASS